MPDAPLERQTGVPLKQSADHQNARRSLSRWAVHLGLLGSAAAALGTLDLLHVRIAIHADVGFVFVALVVVHLTQRPGLEPRRTDPTADTRAFRQMARYLRGRPPRLPGCARLAQKEAPAAVDDPVAATPGTTPTSPVGHLTSA